MNSKIFSQYVCPECKGDLSKENFKEEESYYCPQCNNRYLIKNHIPRFAKELEDVKIKTAKSFGYKWKKFNQIDPSYKLNFLDELAPIDYKNFFKGKRVLDAGTGMGIPSCCIAENGAENVFGVDISSAIEVAYENTKHLSQVSIVQGDIYKLPFKYNSFDVVVCVAVLQHLPSPEKAYRELLKYVKPEGSLIVWVYGKEGNTFIEYFVEPFRKYFSTKIPLPLLLCFSYFLGGVFQLVSRFLYKPLEKTGIRIMPMHSYIAYRSQFDFKMNSQMIFDQLLAPLSYLFTREEVEGFVKGAPVKDFVIRHHNKNSWTLIATKNPIVNFGNIVENVNSIL